MKKAIALGVLLSASLVSFVFAQSSAGTPIVTSTYDLNANPATRLIPATGGTRSVAIAFPTTKGGILMMSPGINEYIRPDRTEVNISTKPNDFTPIQPACNQVNEISSEINLQWVTKASDQPSWGACILEPNKIYYFNIRYVKADGTTACTQATCGAYVDLPPLGTIANPGTTGNGSPTGGSCINLVNTLGFGSRDALTNGEVSKLQRFLNPTYLSVSPTGNFRTMTRTAVNAFQTAYKEDILKKADGTYSVPTGSTGPKTRAKISELSCAGATLTPPALAQSYVEVDTAKSVVSTPSPTNGSFTITSPWAGAVLRNDGSRALFDTIMWNPPAGVSDVSIALYDAGGNRVRTITSINVPNPSDPNAIGMYEWRYIPGIEDGRYKIVITGGSFRAESGVFSLGGGGGGSGPAIINPTNCPTGFTLVNGTCQSNQPTVTNTTPCPAVSTASRTYSRTQRPSFWDSQIAGTVGVTEGTLDLVHYRYPEITEVGKFIYYGERCALSATPGTRTCPYTDSIYGSGADRNAYSILIHAPDQSNDLNEVGDRVYTAYKKPIIGFSRYNRAFDISLPFKISASEVGKKFDFHYTFENQNIANEGQYSISECEGDFSERSVLVANYGAGSTPRASVIATNDLEGSKFIPGNTNPWVTLKTNKVYYLNFRWIKQKALPAYSGASCIADSSNNCLSPFVPTAQIPDSGIHDSALGRQIRNGGNDDALEFYRWDISQQNDAYFGSSLTTEAQLRTDPLFDQPGGAVLSPNLYYPACNAGGITNWGIRGSDCQVRCMAGYTLNAGQCVRQ